MMTISHLLDFARNADRRAAAAARAVAAASDIPLPRAQCLLDARDRRRSAFQCPSIP